MIGCYASTSARTEGVAVQGQSIIDFSMVVVCGAMSDARPPVPMTAQDASSA